MQLHEKVSAAQCGVVEKHCKEISSIPNCNDCNVDCSFVALSRGNNGSFLCESCGMKVPLTKNHLLLLYVSLNEIQLSLGKMDTN